LADQTEKVMNKIKIGLIISVLIMVSLVGSNIWFYVSEQRWRSHYQHVLDQLSTAIEDLQNVSDQVDMLTIKIDNLTDQVNRLRMCAPPMYFFFQDPDLTNASCLNVWRPGFRHPNPQNISEGNFAYILSEVAHLCYNETSGSGWATASLSQGELPHNWGRHPLLLGGCSQEVSSPTPGVTFHRDRLPRENEYILRSKVLVVRREFLADVVNGTPKNNVGITLYCSYRHNCTLWSDYFNPDYNVSSAIYIDIFFSSSNWTSTVFEPIEYRHHAFGDPWTKDHVIVLTVPNQVELVGEWREISVDMRWVFDFVFSYLPSNIESITVRGAQIYSEGIGCLIDCKIDYVKMEINIES